MKHIYFDFTTSKLAFWRANNLFDVAVNSFMRLYLVDNNRDYTSDDIEVKHCARLGVKVYLAMEKALNSKRFYAAIWVTDREYNTMLQAGDKSPIFIKERQMNNEPDSAIGYLNYPKSIL